MPRYQNQLEHPFLTKKSKNFPPMANNNCLCLCNCRNARLFHGHDFKWLNFASGPCDLYICKSTVFAFCINAYSLDCTNLRQAEKVGHGGGGAQDPGHSRGPQEGEQGRDPPPPAAPSRGPDGHGAWTHPPPQGHQQECGKDRVAGQQFLLAR